MASDETPNLVELERISHDLIETFNYAPEFDAIRDINQYVIQLEQNFKQRHDCHSHTMTEVSEGMQKLQKEASDLNSNEYLEQKRELDAKKARLDEKIAQLSRERLQTSAAIEKLRAQCVKLEGELPGYEAESGDDVPRLRHALDLYIQLSSVKWDFGKAPSSLAGTIFFPDRVKPFELEKGAMSQYELTNKIWELLDA